MPGGDLRSRGWPGPDGRSHSRGEVRYKATETLDDVRELAFVLTPPW